MDEPTSQPTPDDPDPTEPMRLWLANRLVAREPAEADGLHHWPATAEQYEALRNWPHLDKIGKMDGTDVVALGVRVKCPAGVIPLRP
jgi:hypothetical protein